MEEFTDSPEKNVTPEEFDLEIPEAPNKSFWQRWKDAREKARIQREEKAHKEEIKAIKTEKKGERKISPNVTAYVTYRHKNL